MLLSVDHGNYAIKTPFFSFVSGLSEHTSYPPLADELLEYDDRFWTLSGKRISYMRDKTQDTRYVFFQSPQHSWGIEFFIQQYLQADNVRNAILAIRKEVGHLPNSKYSKYVWSPAYKGVDDYYHARAAA